MPEVAGLQAVELRFDPSFSTSKPFDSSYCALWGSQVELLVKNLPTNAEDVGSIPGSERFPWRRKTATQSSIAAMGLDRGAWQATVHRVTKNWTRPRTEEPDRLQSMGSLRVGHDWVTSLSVFTFMHWRRKWQPTPVFLPAESQGQGSLVGCHLWGRTELDTTEAIQQEQQQSTLCPTPLSGLGLQSTCSHTPRTMEVQLAKFWKDLMFIFRTQTLVVWVISVSLPVKHGGLISYIYFSLPRS